jgi:HSP20 family molecular chaperone IbpA
VARPAPWDEPAATLRRVSGHLEKIFHELTGGRLRGVLPRIPGAWMPQVAVFRRGDQVVVSIDLPGIRREDVQLDIDERAITIRGERRSADAGGERALRSECSYGRFQRSVPLPEGADPGAARAAMRDGVLEITLPVKRHTRRLDIEDADLASRKEAYRYQAAEPANEPRAPGVPDQDRRGERRDWQSEGRLGM